MSDNNATAILELHPQFTVIAGLDEDTHRSLAQTIIGALGVTEDGTHVEFSESNGSQYVAFRGTKPHMVLDTTTGEDHSSEYLDEQGRIDILRSIGYLSRREAERYCVLDSVELERLASDDLVIDALARLDQTELWALVAAVDKAEASVRVQADAAGPAGLADEMFEIVEERRDETLRTAENLTRWRWASAIVAPVALLASYLVTLTSVGIAALPLLGVAMAAALGSFDAQRRHNLAMQQEERVLLKAEADSYADFQITRGNGLLAGDEQRMAYMDAAKHHQAVGQQWTATFGDVTPTWVRRRRRDIEAVARLYKVADHDDDVVAESTRTEIASLPLSTAMMRWMQSRSIGRSTLPAVLCEPFKNLPAELIPTLLESLVRSSTRRQTVLVTNNADVVAWAGVEGMAGNLSVVNITANQTEGPIAPLMWDGASFEDRVLALRVARAPDSLTS
ncbi:MAG: hypothetical protein IH940_00975 [Acidobacteria bacterium]|nr:hypothetical protein [Acidobacteriota bacterium]